VTYKDAQHKEGKRITQIAVWLVSMLFKIQLSKTKYFGVKITRLNDFNFCPELGETEEFQKI
jgi:hypothetical protein